MKFNEVNVRQLSSDTMFAFLRMASVTDRAKTNNLTSDVIVEVHNDRSFLPVRGREKIKKAQKPNQRGPVKRNS